MSCCMLLCTDPHVGPADLLSALKAFSSPLWTSPCPTASLHSSVPLSILVALQQTHSGLSVPVTFWGCPKLHCDVSSGSQKCWVPRSHGFPGSGWLCSCWYSPVLSPCVAVPVCRDIFVHMCSLLMPLTLLPHSSAEREPPSCAHIHV